MPSETPSGFSLFSDSPKIKSTNHISIGDVWKRSKMWNNLNDSEKQQGSEAERMRKGIADSKAKGV